MREQQQKLADSDVHVLAVTFQSKSVAQTYVAETHLRWPMLVDPSRTMYRAYDMGRGRVRDVWGWSTWWIYFKLMAKGRRPRGAAGDVHQLGGDVLIDPQGRVRLHHVGRGPADRPTLDAILTARHQEA